MGAGTSPLSRERGHSSRKSKGVIEAAARATVYADAVRRRLISSFYFRFDVFLFFFNFFEVWL